MDRRHLLTLLPAASALLAIRANGKPIPAETLTKAGFAISVQCWSFREFTLFEAIKMAAATGAGAVEVFPGQKIGGDLGDAKVDPQKASEQVPAILKKCEEHGIKPVNFGVCNFKKASVKETFEFAKALGLYGITTEEIDHIDDLEKHAKEYDIKVCFHNHPRKPLYKMWDPDFVYESVKDRHENVGFCADIGHWATSGMNPLDVIKKVAPRVRAFHMKERESIEKWSHDRPFGTGVIDNLAILDEVRKAGFAGNVSIEYEHNWKKNVSEVAQCVGYLRAYSSMKG